MISRWSFRLRRPFFARRSFDECEAEYDRLMQEQFQLHKYGGLSLFEQNWLSAQDRAKWLQMTEKDLKDRQEAERKAASNSSGKGGRRR